MNAGFVLLMGLLFMGGSSRVLFAADGATSTVMFYNCENLYDPIDDPHTSDNEFLPQSRRNWTWQKYQQGNTCNGY